MPPQHRAFIEANESAEGRSIRRFSLGPGSHHHELRDAYNACIRGLAFFRSKHLEYAHTYIHQQSQRTRGNPTHIGTGGTPFMPYLKKHRDKTLDHEIGTDPF